MRDKHIMEKLRTESRIFIILCLISLSAIPKSLFAYQNEPDGFRGIEWGAAVEKIDGMVRETDLKGMRLYKREGEKMKLDGIPVDRIQYIFNREGRFFIIGIDFSPEHFDAIKKRAFDRHGKAAPDEKGKYVWDGKTTWMRLWLDRQKGVGSLGYGYKPLMKTMGKPRDTVATFENMDVVLRIVSTLAILAMIIVGVRTKRKKERKELPKKTAPKPEPGDWESAYRKHRIAAIIVAAVLLCSVAAVEILALNVDVRPALTIKKEVPPVMGIGGVLFMTMIMLGMGWILCGAMPGHSIGQLKNRAQFSCMIAIGAGSSGPMFFYFLGNTLYAYVSAPLGVLVLCILFPKREKWTETEVEIEKPGKPATWIEDFEPPPRLKRCLKEDGDVMSLSALDPRMKKLVSIPFIPVFAAIFFMFLSKAEQMGPDSIILFAIFPFIFLVLLFALFMDRGFEFDRKNRTLNEYIRIFGFKRSKTVGLSEFEHIKLEKGQADYIFEVNLDGPDLLKTILTTTNENEAMWFASVLSRFLTMEVSDET